MLRVQTTPVHQPRYGRYMRSLSLSRSLSLHVSHLEALGVGLADGDDIVRRPPARLFGQLPSPPQHV